MSNERVIFCDRCRQPLAIVKAGEPVNTHRWLCQLCRYEQKHAPARRLDQPRAR